MTGRLRAAWRWLATGRRLAWAWVLVMSAGFGWVVARETSEDTRLDAAADRAAVEQIRAELDRQATAAAARARRQCEAWRREAAVQVNPSTTDLGRVVIRNAAALYTLDPTCRRVLGELPPVDPDAYTPSPAPR